MTQTVENPRSTETTKTGVRLHGPLGTPISGDLYEPPSGRSKKWGIVVCPGYGSVKELMTSWGEALAARGLRTLVIGYRGYGDTPGGIGRIFPEEHVEDARSAVRWIRASGDSGLESVAVLGVSYGGAIAVQTAAVEQGVDAAISIVGYGSGSRHLRALRRYSEWVDLLERVEADRANRVVTGESNRITLDEILLRDEEAQQWRERVEAEYPGMSFDVTVESVDRLIEFEPERHLPFRREVPFLIIHAGEDHIIPMDEATSLLQRADQPKRLVVLDGVEHHDVHQGEPFDRCLDEVESFLTAAHAAASR